MVRFLKYIALAICFWHSFEAHAQADIEWLRKIHANQPLKSDGFHRFLSNSVTPLMFATPVVYFGIGAFNSNQKIKENTFYQNGLKSAFCIGGAGLLSYGLKITINRPRPYVTYPDIVPKMEVGTKSFPSGHTTFAFALATSLTLNHKKWYVGVPAFVWAFGVGYSRMHLGVHYPSDVIGGAVLGTGAALLINHFSQKLFK